MPRNILKNMPRAKPNKLVRCFVYIYVISIILHKFHVIFNAFTPSKFLEALNSTVN